MKYPEFEIIERKQGGNMQSWRKKNDDGTEWIYDKDGNVPCRAIFGIKINELNGWKQIGEFEWDYFHNNFIKGTHEEHEEDWYEDGVYWKKVGGKITNVIGFSMYFWASGEFMKNNKIVNVEVSANIMRIVDKTTGEVQIEYATEFDGGEKEPEEETVPKEKPKKKLLITFVKGNWLIAALQSFVFFKRITKIWTHVQMGFSDTNNDFSAEASGMQFVSRKETKEKARESYTVELEITDEQAERVESSFEKYLNDKYDYFFYFRWFFNVMILPFVIGLIPALFGGIIVGYLITMVVIYTLVNFVLSRLAKNKWGCSEIVSKILSEIGRDYGYGKVFHTASPQDMYEKEKFALN